MHYLKLLTIASTVMLGTVVAFPTQSNSDLGDPSGERNPDAWIPIPVDCDLRLQHDQGKAYTLCPEACVKALRSMNKCERSWCIIRPELGWHNGIGQCWCTCN